MQCPNCRTDMAYDDVFCQQCGARKSTPRRAVHWAWYVGIGTVVVLSLLYRHYATEVLRTFASYGSVASADTALNNSIGPLHYAVIPIVRALRRREISTAAATPNAAVRLVSAAEAGHDRVVRLMVSLGTPVDAPGYKGITPLMGAASEQQVGAMIVLLELGANPNAQDEFGYTALHRIAGSGRVTYLQTGTGASGPAATQAAQALLDAHASIDTPDSRGQTPLHAAVAANDVEMARFLLAKNANPSTGDRDGETTLGLAIDAGAVQMAKVLLDGGADLARKDQFGRTYLHLAARKGSVEIVTFLLGKDSVKRAINEKDSDGNTAWDVATGPVAHAIDAAGGRTGRKTPYYTPSFDFSLQPDTPTAVETTETPETSGPSPDAESPGVPGSSIP